MEAKMNEPESNEHQQQGGRDVQQLPPTIEGGHQAINDPTSSNRGDQKQTNWPQRIEAVCALLLVIITGTYTYYAAGQLHKMKRSTDAAERAAVAADNSAQTADKTLRMAYRPWVNAESAELADPLVNPPPPRFHVKLKFTFKNTGTSVSTDGVAIANLVSEESNATVNQSEKICGQLDQSKIPVDKNMRPRATGFVLAPGNVLHQSIGMWSDEISDQQAIEGKFYVIGCLIYRDQFKAWHHTKFCFRPSGPTTDAKTTFEICEVYEEAD
jgi:hypothetical protein